MVEQRVKDTSEVLTAIDKGTRARTTGSTSANETSSRSHSIFQISLVTGARQAGAGSSNGCSRKLSLIDLAAASVSVQSVSLYTRPHGASRIAKAVSPPSRLTPVPLPNENIGCGPI